MAMTTEKIIKKLELTIKKMFRFENSGHDFYHLKRTLNNALLIQKKEGGDKLTIAVAAFLHDLHRIIQKKTGQFCSPKDSLPKVKKILDKTALSDKQKEKIMHCIEFHEEYGFSKAGKSAGDLETLIVQDADNLDAMGAIGIGRTFSYSGAHHLPMHDPEKPFDRKFFSEDKNDFSTIHHFYSKLFKLKDNMNTVTAKRLAITRHRFMKQFLKQFFAEWQGNSTKNITYGD